MKKDLDTVAVDLKHETVYLQVSRELLEEDRPAHGWRQHLHKHMVYEMHMVTRGACRINVDGEVIPLREGQAIVIAPLRHHGSRSEDGEFERVSFFFLPDEKATSLAAALGRQIIGCRAFSATGDMLETGRRILREQNGQRPCRREMRQALLTALLIDTFRALALFESPQEENDKEPSRMFLCDEYFSRYAKEKNAAQLAGSLHMSERQMNRCLREFYGMNFRQKLTHTRMEAAAFLLRTSAHSAEVIAETVGYESESGFFKAFRKHYGMTPLQYRSQNRAGR